MNTFTITSTDLKRNTAAVINKVQYTGKTAVVKKHGKVVVRVIKEPDTKAVKENKMAKTIKLINKFRLSPVDFPEVERINYSHRPTPDFDAAS